MLPNFENLKSPSGIAALSCVSVWDSDLKVCYIDLDKEESDKMNLLGRVGTVFLVVINIFFIVSVPFHLKNCKKLKILLTICLVI